MSAETTCPSWCDGPNDPTIHAGDGNAHISQEGGDLDYGTTVYQRFDDGNWLVPVSFDLLADVHWRGNILIEDLTAAGCRELSGYLLAAAEKLDAINDEVSA